MATGLGGQYQHQHPLAEKTGAKFPALADWNGNRAQRRMAKRLKLPKPATKAIEDADG